MVTVRRIIWTLASSSSWAARRRFCRLRPVASVVGGGLVDFPHRAAADDRAQPEAAGHLVGEATDVAAHESVLEVAPRFGERLGFARIGLGLVGLQSGADILADVDVGDVDRDDLESRVRVEPPLECSTECETTEPDGTEMHLR